MFRDGGTIRCAATRSALSFECRLGRTLAALWIGGCLPACGSIGSTPDAMGGDGASNGPGCGAAEVYCTACDGGGFCSQQCPRLACPLADDAGAAEAGAAEAGADATVDASRSEGGVCPASAPAYCLDCNGGGFCVSGSCPATTCPVRDSGASPPPDGSTGCRTNNDCAPSFQPCNGPGVVSLPYPPPATPVIVGGAPACDADVHCDLYRSAPFCKSSVCSAACNSDSDCAPDAGYPICVTVSRPNSAPTNGCDPGCSGGGGGYCPEGSTCGSSHRCVAIACSVATDCPAQFDCVQSTCTRRACQKDGDCSLGGYCVQGLCSMRLGTCSMPYP